MELERYSDWIETFTGVKFYPLEPRMEEIRLDDIAHALSLLCRYNGHSKKFYSVAQHSVLCALEAEFRELPKDIVLRALLHDAQEAYLSDVARPIKPYLSGFSKIEKKLQSMIYTKFGLDPRDKRADKLVSDIDYNVLFWEADVLMKSRGKIWDNYQEPSLQVLKHLEKEALLELISGQPRVLEDTYKAIATTLCKET